MSKLSRHHPRPRIQRTFVRWFRENRSRFIVPIQITEVSHSGIGLKFPSHPGCLSVGLSRFDLSVYVDWQGTGWDMLISLDAVPERVPGGYRSVLNTDLEQVLPTREAVWRNDLFEPFLSWVNNKLAIATALRLYGQRGESTWAILFDEIDELQESSSCAVSIPLPSFSRPVGSSATSGRLNGSSKAKLTESLIRSHVPLPTE
ncbi:MAG: hypothetical protein WCH60_19835 [Burkholderiales bacterium]